MLRYVIYVIIKEISVRSFSAIKITIRMAQWFFLRVKRFPKVLLVTFRIYQDYLCHLQKRAGEKTGGLVNFLPPKG